MPLIRYLFVVGSALLALLFISNSYLPKPEAVASNSDVPSIRIRSDRKAPELIVYDTTHPPAVIQQVAQVPTVTPARVADSSAKTRILDAFAQLQPTQSKSVEAKAVPVNLVQPAPVAGDAANLKAPARPLPKHKTAKTRVGPPTVLVAQHQQQFGFFASNSW